MAAFQDRDPIRLDGDIFRVRNLFELRNPRNLSLATEQADHFVTFQAPSVPV